MDIDPSSAQQRSSRKHTRSSDEFEDTEWSSDVSGRFDDADEPDPVPEYSNSPSAKSVKRRRSNDWPLPEEAADYGKTDRRNTRNGNASLGASFRSSPRTSAASLRSRNKVSSTNSPRHHRLGRRSRFVEANMSDSVSEKPPSILFREGKAAGPQNRQSGIFRFGKAIASAFNPFGGWNKAQPDQANKAQPQKTALSQAEEAYAELKRAGFKGTNKGAYLQSQSVDPGNADQTWQAIQEKMGYGGAISNPLVSPKNQNAQFPTPLQSPSKSNKRSSFQDLRKTASMGLPFMKHHEQQSSHATSLCQDHPSEDSENAASGLRKQKSRKEISREARLLKKVNTLEDKLDRARRELRELSGNEERVLAPISEPRSMSIEMIEMDPGSYPRKFIPGALPTLPSERLLDQQKHLPESSKVDADPVTALPSIEDQMTHVDQYKQVSNTSPTIKSPRRRSKDLRPSSMGKESSSLKRKSPVPEPIASRIPVQPRQTYSIDDFASENDSLIHSDILSTPRQAKWQKFDAGDSPGSIGRSHINNRQGSPTKSRSTVNKNAPSSQFENESVNPNDLQNFKNTKSPPPLRTQHRRSDLRVDSPLHVSGTTPMSDVPGDMEFSPPPQPSNAHQSFYLQSQRDLDPDRAPRSSPSKTSPSLTRRRSHDTNIPPVPPLPKELMSNAAKVTKPPSKKTHSRQGSAASILSPQPISIQNHQPIEEQYPFWTDEIF